MKRPGITHYLPVFFAAGLGAYLLFPFSLELLGPAPIDAQAVYTELENPEQIRTFTRVSNAIVCQCGCNFVLSSCPHVECPWGIPVRRFIEARILMGDDADSIVSGLIHGFGPEIRDMPVIQVLIAQGRSDIAQELEVGYGPEVQAHVSGTSITLALSMGLAVLAVVFWLWWRRNRARQRPSGPAGKETPIAPEVLEKIRRLDQ
ncbi:MAG: hypothetical protein H7A21_14475 [Spirochaetales bacterium]|nr:hypothetical protein [Leptospiraceae bacterium]MCB1326984.1 hypothetical protein [Leptospiraceae bacterium]MCP5482638.1 hypothetical protein [Spirochaetales bacterium]MCP5485019.1 hypothetical protein [Spirochaetales bacterium]